MSPTTPVWPDSTPFYWSAAIPIIFHESPLVAIILARLLTTLFLYLHQSMLQPYPSGLLIHRVVSVWGCHLNMEAFLVPITLVLRLTGRMQLALSLTSLYGTGADALDKLELFLSILILALYSFILREVTKRVPF